MLNIYTYIYIYVKLYIYEGQNGKIKITLCEGESAHAR